MSFRHSIFVGAVTGLLVAVFNHNALATNLKNGDFTTHVQADWGDTPNPMIPNNAASLLENNYDTVYASTYGTLEVGLLGPTGFSMVFSGAPELLYYLPDVGAIGQLNSDLVNPSSTSAGAFGGDVTALVLNIDFSDAGLLPGNLGIPFGDLVLVNFTPPPGALGLNRQTVRQFSAIVNNVLGGGSYTGYSIATLDSILANINASFSQGEVSPYATNHLAVPTISLVIQSVAQSGNALAFTWNTIPNQRYQVQSTRSLPPTNWASLGGIITATNTTMSASDTLTNAQMFYRIELLP
jgi:hypothetical protein